MFQPQNFKKNHFFTRNFFSMDLRNFSTSSLTMFKLFERLSKHSSLCWSKNQEHTTHQRDYMAGNVKKFGFLKINFKNGVEKLWDILPKTPFFSLKTFFQWFWETFLYVVWLCSSYLRDCLNIALYAGKKNQERTTRRSKNIEANEKNLKNGGSIGFWRCRKFWLSLFFGETFHFKAL